MWWKEVEKDPKSEENWYNYFRASRNAQGTDDWKTDFVKESPALRLGPDALAIVERTGNADWITGVKAEFK